MIQSQVNSFGVCTISADFVVDPVKSVWELAKSSHMIESEVYCTTNRGISKHHPMRSKTTVKSHDLFICPVCGEEVPTKAIACPGCGADDETGWNKEITRLDGLDLPDSGFNYDEFVAEEFGSSAKPKAISWAWWVAGIVTTLAVLYLLLRGAW